MLRPKSRNIRSQSLWFNHVVGQEHVAPDKPGKSSRIPEDERAYGAGLRLLSYRPRSFSEVRQRLARRFTTGAVNQALARLTERGYLDDAAFARFWRENREAHRPRGALLIKQELLQRGVAREVAEAATEGMDDGGNAYRAGLGRLRAMRGLDEATFHRRMGDYLRRRGFNYGLARRTVQRLWEERET